MDVNPENGEGREKDDLEIGSSIRLDQERITPGGDMDYSLSRKEEEEEEEELSGERISLEKWAQRFCVLFSLIFSVGLIFFFAGLASRKGS